MNSPIHHLVSAWFGTKPPVIHRVSALRADLYQAAAETIRYKAAADLIYDPPGDCRFQWACQWLDVANGTRLRIDLGVTDSAAWLFRQQAPATAAHAAAADHTLEESTKH